MKNPQPGKQSAPITLNPLKSKKSPWPDKVPASDPRKQALFIIDRAEAGGQDISLLINKSQFAHSFDRRDLALMNELVYGVFRQKGWLDWLIDHFSKKNSVKRPIRLILRLALYQVLFLDRIPPHAIVHTSVDLAKKRASLGAGRFVNALLRTIIRTLDQLPQPSRKNMSPFIAVTTSHPEWMVRRWLARFGEAETLALCRSNNEIPPMTLRVNRLKTDRIRLAETLKADGASVTLCKLSPDALIAKGLSIVSHPAFTRGEFYIQDEGAQLISYLVAPLAGEKILDFCAAPGGKTTHIAELSGGKAEIIATDHSTKRLGLLSENLQRLQTPGIKIEEMSQALATGRLYDCIVVDAPCSALGILRRIPEGKWRKKQSLIADSAKVQLEILEQVFPYLKGGGRLIYATCSTESEENEDVVEAFSKGHPEMDIAKISDLLPPSARPYVNEKRYFTSVINSDNMDRFFAVCWVKRS